MSSQIRAAGPSAPSSPITERRSVEGEEAIDVGTTSATHRYFGQGWSSAAMDEPNWIFYDELESAAAASRICPRQKPQRFIRAFRALHISRSSTRLSPSDPSRSASPRPLGSNPASPVHLKHHLDSLVPISIALPACTRQSAVIYARERFPVGNAGCREPVPVSSLVSRRLLFVQSRLRG